MNEVNGLRSAVWSGSYLIFILLPLGVAFAAGPGTAHRGWLADFAAALGLLAFALIALEFMLISRLRAVTDIFGVDVLTQLHRWMGMFAIVFVVGHGLASLPALTALEWRSLARGGSGLQTGLTALLACGLIFATSVTRRRLGLRYETWLWSHATLACTVVALGLWHALSIGRHASHAPVRFTLAAYALLVLLISLWRRVVRPLQLSRRPWSVASNTDIGGDTRLLTVKPVGHGGLAFAPGQFVWLLTGRHALVAQQHPITIASSAEASADRGLEFAIKAFGDWSGETVLRLAQGTRLWLDGAYGALTPDRYPAQGFVLIAGGLGITPMRSMLLTMRDRGDTRPVLLIHAANRPERMIFREELAALASEMNLRIVTVFENPPPDWPGERGVITAALLRRHLPPRFRHFQFLVCGPSPMMDALEAELRQLGVPSEHVATERFN